MLYESYNMERHSRELLESAAKQAIHETTPKVISDAILSLCNTLIEGSAPVFVEVVEDKLGLYGFCSDGVHKRVQESGGSLVFGWVIWEWPKVLLTAEFHTVWEDADGRVLDITPKPAGEKSILFLPDRSYRIDFNFDERPRNVRVSIADADAAEIAAQAKMSLLNGARLKYDETQARKRGLPLLEYLRSRHQPTVLPVAVQRWLEACDAFDEHFDSLGGPGQVAIDKKFVELGKRRVEAQHTVYGLLGIKN